MALLTAVDKVIDRPRAHLYAGLGVVVAITAYLMWSSAISPSIEKQTELKDNISNLQLKKAEQLRIVRDLPKYTKEVKEYDDKLEALLLELPDKRQIPSFLSSIETLGSETGLQVTKFVPQPEKLSEFFAQVPVYIEVTGQFHQLVTFFDEVAHLNRIVNISGIDINILKERAEAVSIAASFKATTFRYLDAEEIAAVEAAKKKKKKKKRR